MVSLPSLGRAHVLYSHDVFLSTFQAVGHVAVMSMYILMEGNQLLKVNSSLVAVTERIPFITEPDREQPQQLGRSSNSEGNLQTGLT